MDILENENFFSSRFKSLDEKFWYKRVSWMYARKVFNYKADAWHIAKSCMIVLIVLSIVTYEPIVSPWVDIVIYGVAWNIVFEQFYRFLKL